MIEASSGTTETECSLQEEYKNAWLNVIIDEILLECYEGLF